MPANRIFEKGHSNRVAIEALFDEKLEIFPSKAARISTLVVTPEVDCRPGSQVLVSVLNSWMEDIVAENKSVLGEILSSVAQAASRVIDGALNSTDSDSSDAKPERSLQDEAYWNAKRTGGTRPDENPFSR